MIAFDVLCAQLTRDLFAIAKFLLTIGRLLLHCWYSLGRPVTIGTPVVIFAVLTVFWLFLVAVGTFLVDMWRLVHQWSFLCCFDCVLTVFDCFWRLVHYGYTVGTVLVDLWRLVHQWSFLLFCLSFDCFWYTVNWYTVGTVFVHQWLFLCCFDCVLTVLTIGTLLVHCLYSLGRPVTICTPLVLSVFDDW